MLNENKFLALLMGEHWHEGIIYPSGQQSVYKCSCMEHQSIEPLSKLNPDYDIIEIFVWMEENMPKVLYDYLALYLTDIDGIFSPHNFLETLYIPNLVQYLLDNPEWGEQECPECKDQPIKGYGVWFKTGICPVCNGKTKIIHPALEYLLSEDKNGS